MEKINTSVFILSSRHLTRLSVLAPAETENE